MILKNLSINFKINNNNNNKYNNKNTTINNNNSNNTNNHTEDKERQNYLYTIYIIYDHHDVI